MKVTTMTSTMVPPVRSMRVKELLERAERDAAKAAEEAARVSVPRRAEFALD